MNRKYSLNSLSNEEITEGFGVEVDRHNLHRCFNCYHLFLRWAVLKVAIFFYSEREVMHSSISLTLDDHPSIVVIMEKLMIRPPYLKNGDTIAIAAPARKILREELLPAVNLFEKEGFKVIVLDGLFEVENQLAGSDEHRASLISELLKNPEVKAILFARGGYGSIRTLQYIPSNLFIENLKWIIGYSDITVFHSFLSQHGMQSLHATMPINFPKSGEHNQSTRSLIDALMGTNASVEVPSHVGNVQGTVRGILSGGNLSVLYSLAATPIDLIPEGRILIIEDLDEYLYHIDRMMMNLKYSGKMSKIAGLIVGHLSDMRDNTTPWGKDAYEIVQEIAANLSIPVAFGFPIGHLEPNLAFVMGAEVELTVTSEFSSLVYLD